MTKAFQCDELETLPLRSIWAHESQQFTPWLAANISRLADAIGIPLAVLGGKTTAAGGIADLLARNLRDGSIVVIENQLEPGDDDHFNRLLTYLAGFEARTVVWIAASFDETLRSAIRELNTSPASTFAFFAVRLRVARVGTGQLDVIFDVLECPIGWDQARRNVAPSAVGRLMATESVGPYARFWDRFLTRHPDEVARSRQIGTHCRWRTSLPAGVVIGQRIVADAVGIFIRGRNGMPIRRIRDRLAPFEGLPRALGIPALAIEEASVMAGKRLPISTSDPTNWERMADWLHAEADIYERALREAHRLAAMKPSPRNAATYPGKPKSRRSEVMADRPGFNPKQRG